MTAANNTHTNWSGSAELSEPWNISPSTEAQFWLRVTEAGLVSAVGLFTNTVTAVMMIKARLLKNWTYCMIWNLCLAGALLCLVNLLCNLPNIIAGRWLYDVHICRLRIMLPSGLLTFFILSSFISGLQRYFLIVRNRNLAIFSIKWQPLLLFIMWLFCIAITLLLVFPGRPRLRTYRDFCYILNTSSPLLLLTFIVLTSAPIFIVPLLYLHIYIVVKRASSKIHSVDNNAQKNKNRNGSEQAKTNTKQTRSALKLFIIYVTFMVTFLPFVAYSAFPVDDSNIHFTRYGDSIVWMFIYAGCAASPIVYAYLFNAISAAFRTCCQRSQRSNVMVLDGTMTLT